MQKERILKKNSNIVSRVIADEVILVPICKNSDDINCIYTLNKVAFEVWKMTDGKKTLSEIKGKIMKKFDTTPKEVDIEMDKFLKDLKKIKAIC